MALLESVKLLRSSSTELLLSSNRVVLVARRVAIIEFVDTSDFPFKLRSRFNSLRTMISELFAISGPVLLASKLRPISCVSTLISEVRRTL